MEEGDFLCPSAPLRWEYWRMMPVAPWRVRVHTCVRVRVGGCVCVCLGGGEVKMPESACRCNRERGHREPTSSQRMGTVGAGAGPSSRAVEQIDS